MNPSMTEYHHTYLKISAYFNNQKGEVIRTGDALRQLSEIINNTGPMNPLHYKAVSLQHAIIHMDDPVVNSRTQGSTTATILSFPPIRK